MADDGSQYPRIPPRLRDWQELNRRVSDMSANLLARLEIIEQSIAPPNQPGLNPNAWYATESGGDWVPTSTTQWVGDGDNHPNGVAVGVPTGDPGTLGITGIMTERTGAADGAGGVAIVGYTDQPAGNSIVDPGLLANAPVEISGVPSLLMGNVVAEVGASSTKQFYALYGATTTLTDGRHVAPLLVGPEYIPATKDEQTDVRDIELDGLGTDTQVVTLTLANAYLSNIAVFEYEVRLSEEGGQTVEFDVAIFYQALGAGPFSELLREPISLSGTAQNLTFSTTAGITLSATDVLEMRVNAVDTHPQSDGWVRGSVRASRLTVRQG